MKIHFEFGENESNVILLREATLLQITKNAHKTIWYAILKLFVDRYQIPGKSVYISKQCILSFFFFFVQIFLFNSLPEFAQRRLHKLLRRKVSVEQLIKTKSINRNIDCLHFLINSRLKNFPHKYAVCILQWNIFNRELVTKNKQFMYVHHPRWMVFSRGI